MPALQFFYDFVCPYAYLASLDVDRLALETESALVFRPILLGGVFRAIGGPDDPNVHKPAPKAALDGMDLERAARARGVTLVRPEGHSRRTVLALRAAIASSELRIATRALFAAYWQHGRDLEDPAVVAAALDAEGLDGARAVAEAEAPRVKEALRAATDEAVRAGIFGVPSFLVPGPEGPELYWGQDRLDDVRAAVLAPQTLPFYFDYASPFAYLASTQVRAVAARTRAKVDYRPILLGGLFKSIGTPNVPLFEMPGAKRDYVMRDLERRAERMTVPYFFPSRFPMNTVKALRLTLAADAVQRPALVDALFRALWVDDKDISDTDQLQRIAASCGALDALRRIENPEIKQALFSATDEAKARGVFGVPTFVARNELFFGQDRLHQVERALLGY